MREVKKIKKYPFVKQNGSKECAPACVQMILKYYGGYVSIDKLSEMMNTNKNGTSAYHIKETLNNLGFRSYGLKSENVENLKLPCIAHITINHSYKHYIVIYKINLKKQYLIIADPGQNIKKISFQTFQTMWQGITIQMYPITKPPCEQKPKIFKFIWYYIKNNMQLIIILSLLSLFISFLSIISSFFLPAIITSLSNQNQTRFICTFFIIVFIFKDIINFIKNKILIKLNTTLDKQLSLDIFKQIINLPYRYYRRKTTGEITSYFNDLYVIKDFINFFSQIILIYTPLILFIIITIFNFDISLFSINLIGIIFLILITIIFQKKNNLWILESTRKKALINSYMVESIIGFESIKNLNISKKIYKHFENKYYKFTTTIQKKMNIDEKNKLLKNLIYNISIFIIIIYSIRKYNSNLTIILIFILSETLISSVKSITDFDYKLSEVKASLINLTELKTAKSENIKTIQSKGNINIKNLNYAFDNKVLKNINLIIENKSKVMVTGKSGSGKSTLFKIIKGYYKDYIGTVKIDGREIKKYNFSNIIYISQKETLFTGTLLDNLKIKSKELQNLDICEIDDIIQNNYYQLIEEDGFNLSGGQKQRLVLARALNNFKILIIDEGLNQISVDMERRILKKLFKKYKNQTIIYISHRLDNLDLFDRFIKIDDGQVVLDVKRNN